MKNVALVVLATALTMVGCLGAVASATAAPPHAAVLWARGAPDQVGRYGGLVQVAGAAKHASTCQLKLLSRTSLPVLYSKDAKSCTTGTYSGHVLIGANPSSDARVLTFALVARNKTSSATKPFQVTIAATAPTTTTTTRPTATPTTTTSTTTPTAPSTTTTTAENSPPPSAPVNTTSTSTTTTSTTTTTVPSTTSLSGVTVAISPELASSTATYTVAFKTTAQALPGEDIYLSEEDGPTNFSTEVGVLVVDATTDEHFVANGVLAGTGVNGSGGLAGSCTVGATGCSASGALEIPITTTIPDGDMITVTVVDVTNPGASTYADFDASTSSDYVPAAASSYVISTTLPSTTTTTTPAGPPPASVTNVTLAPAGVTAGVSASFSITFTATAALSASAHSTITLVPSRALASTPASNVVELVDTSGDLCFQDGPDGGAVSSSSITIDLGNCVGIASGDTVNVVLTADAPVSAGTLQFAVTTSANPTPASSNEITVAP